MIRVGTLDSKHDGIARGMFGFITEEIFLTIPPPKKQIGVVEQGQANIVRNGLARWYLAFYQDGNLCAAKRMPEDQPVTRGMVCPLYFEEYNI
jgi:hypothetical protein